jgi:GNAT superfamily N-acetyltransferase
VPGREFIVRRGRRDDAADAARLWVASAEEHTAYDPIYATSPDARNTMRRFLADLTSSSQSFLFVAVLEGETIGFISGELREGSPTFHPRTWASVDDVYVVPEYRSLGVGRALLENVESWARERNASGISLQVAAANGRGRKFYKTLGFREVSVYEVLEFDQPSG